MTRQSSKLQLRMTYLYQNLWYYKQNAKLLHQKSKRQPYLHIQKNQGAPPLYGDAP